MSVEMEQARRLAARAHLLVTTKRGSEGQVLQHLVFRKVGNRAVLVGKSGSDKGLLRMVEAASGSRSDNSGGSSHA